jgi:hypothetical protein
MRDRLFTLIAALAVAVAMIAGGQPVATDAQTTTYYRDNVLFSSAQVISADAASTNVITGVADATLAAFQHSCTEDSGTATLDIAIQRSIDGGTTWVNVTTFTQLSATGTQQVVYADVRASSAQMIGGRLRANYDITGTGQYTCTTVGAFEA